MTRRCELSGKAVLVGNRVSHANNKTKHRFMPNLQQVSLLSETLGQTVHLRITPHALRSVEARGGLDSFPASVRTAISARSRPCSPIASGAWRDRTI